jgi:hypothetical protein
MVNTGIMSSERNWPARLGPEPEVPHPPVVAGVHQMLTAGTTTGGIDPATVADAVLEGIRSNRFVLSTHPDQITAAARARLAHAEGIPAV